MKKRFLLVAVLFVSHSTFAGQSKEACLAAINTLPELTYKLEGAARVQANMTNKYAYESGYPPIPGLEACYRDYFRAVMRADAMYKACPLETKIDDALYKTLTGEEFPDCSKLGR